MLPRAVTVAQCPADAVQGGGQWLQQSDLLLKDEQCGPLSVEAGIETIGAWAEPIQESAGRVAQRHELRAVNALAQIEDEHDVDRRLFLAYRLEGLEPAAVSKLEVCRRQSAHGQTVPGHEDFDPDDFHLGPKDGGLGYRRSHHQQAEQPDSHEPNERPSVVCQRRSIMTFARLRGPKG